MTEPESRGKRYAAPGVSVFYDVQKCIHAAACVRGLPEAFKPGERPWIQPDQAPPEQIAEVVRRCPTGALHYELAGGPAESADEQTMIAPQPNGPLFVRGDIVIQIGDRVIRETRAALCRCGQSANKPFCDGTHARINWRSDDQAATD